MLSVRIVLAAGLALIAAAAIVMLSRSPLTLAGTNSVQPASKLALTTTNHANGCQAGETLPYGTSAVRLSLFAVVGPRVTVKLLSGSHVLTSGTQAPGWVGSVVTVPVKPLRLTRSPVEICFQLSAISGAVQVIGESTPRAEAAISNGEKLTGRIRVEYLRPGERSWWSLAGSVVRRMSLGHAAAGVWSLLLTVALAGAVITLSTLLAARELR